MTPGVLALVQQDWHHLWSPGGTGSIPGLAKWVKGSSAAKALA